MKLYQVINELIDRLPVEKYEDSFLDGLQSQFDAYNKILEKIEEDDFISLFKGATSVFVVQGLTKRKFMNFMTKTQETILFAIKSYYEGYPNKAYNILYALLFKNKVLRPIGGRSINAYLCDLFINYFDVKIERGTCSFYRMRVIKDKLDIKELFHVPFDKRENVSSARFSIVGFPCLYLGTSLKVCWNEIAPSKEDQNHVYASRFQNQKRLVLLNLTIPERRTKNTIVYDSSSFRFLVTYPFFLSCLMKVKHPESKFNFKPEYIIPQILLQCVKYDGMLNGIIYSSTKDKGGKAYDNCKNIVIPTQEVTGTGFCSKMKETFFLSEPELVTVTKLKEAERKLNAITLKKI